MQLLSSACWTVLLPGSGISVRDRKKDYHIKRMKEQGTLPPFIVKAIDEAQASRLNC